MTMLNHLDCGVDLLDPFTLRLSGTLQLQSMRAYEQLFAGAAAALDEDPDAFTIDLRDVVFMNSSALTAVARLILQARDRGAAITLRGSSTRHWQLATLRTLGRLHRNVTVDFG